MKFIHTGDLHIGKILNEVSLLADQRYILYELVKYATDEKVDAFVIAGDLYDRSIPSTEAVALVDDFLAELIHNGIKVLLISGNHDSPERVQFANRILEKQGLYIAGCMKESEQCKQVYMEDSFGKVCFTLIPFVRPAVMGCKNSQEMVDKVISAKTTIVDESIRNICVTHYFITDAGVVPSLSDSETGISVGGIDRVEAASFHSFDYVALGHIHKAQKIGDRNIYYAGTPLKYSFSEWKQDKTVNLVTMEEKGDIKVESLMLDPLHDMRCIKGKLRDLISDEVVNSGNSEDYMYVTLTDDEELFEPMATLRSVYPNVMQMVLEKNLKTSEGELQVTNLLERKSNVELFEDFYEYVKGESLSKERECIIANVFEEVDKP